VDGSSGTCKILPKKCHTEGEIVFPFSEVHEGGGGRGMQVVT